MRLNDGCRSRGAPGLDPRIRGHGPCGRLGEDRRRCTPGGSLGFESIWLFDHFHTVPSPEEEITFESFTALSALAMVTDRVRLGHLVSCAGYRNPALVAKMIATMDAISGGRMELGLGAGWKRDEWRAYGYGFPSLRERQQRLDDALAIAAKMLAEPRASHAGAFTQIADAINVPQPAESQRVPLMVGGNGRDVTWRLAARYADELNLDNVPPEEIDDAMRVIADRCREIDRDPGSSGCRCTSGGSRSIPGIPCAS